MKRTLLILALVLAPLAASAQEASDAEKATLGEIAKCMVAGLPKDWREARMDIELPSPGASTGEVKYTFLRELAGGKFEIFSPCDKQAPARALVDLRKQQAPERAAWSSARFVLYRDGKFDLHYDYPPKKK